MSLIGRCFGTFAGRSALTNDRLLVYIAFAHLFTRGIPYHWKDVLGCFEASKVVHVTNSTSARTNSAGTNQRAIFSIVVLYSNTPKPHTPEACWAEISRLPKRILLNFFLKWGKLKNVEWNRNFVQNLSRDSWIFGRAIAYCKKEKRVTREYRTTPKEPNSNTFI